MANNNKDGSRGPIRRAWSYIWPENIAPTILVVIALGLAGINLSDFTADSITLSITLSVLSLFVVSLIRDRVERRGLIEEIKRLASTHAHGSADKFFTRETSESRITGRARTSLRALQETGSLLLERCQDQIIRLLVSGAPVRLLVTLPNSTTTSYLAYRNANLVSRLGIESRLNQFSAQISGVSKEAAEATARLEVRYTAYDCGYTTILADGAPTLPRSAGGLAMIRISGYRIPYKEKIDFLVEEEDSPEIFRHYLSEFDDLFRCSTKIVLVSADPKIGKTRIFQDMLRSYTDGGELYFAISEGLWEAARRVGFAVRTSLSPAEPKKFATLRDQSSRTPGDISKYDLDIGVWDDIGKQVNTAHAEGKIIVIDEIGEIQLQSAVFRDSIKSLIDDPSATLFATIPSDIDRDDIIGRLVYSPRSTLILLRRENDQQVLEELKKELEGSMHLGRYLAGKN